MSSLESIAILASSVACFYYGLYGISLIGTRDCSNADVTLGNQTVKLTVMRATIHCMLAFAAGVVLVYFEQWAGTWDASNAPSTFGSAFGASTDEGAYFRSMVWRYSGALAFNLAIYWWMQQKVLGPLQNDQRCFDTSVDKASLAYSVQQALSQVPVTPIILGVYFLCICFSSWQMHAFEKKHWELQGGDDDRRPSFWEVLWGSHSKGRGHVGHHRQSVVDTVHSHHNPKQQVPHETQGNQHGNAGQAQNSTSPASAASSSTSLEARVTNISGMVHQ